MDFSLSRVKLHLLVAFSALIIMVVIGTMTYKFLENWTWIQSFYFSVTTLTTVGYGDLHPTTDISRLFTAVFILSGVAIVLSALTIMGNYYLHEREIKLLERKEKKQKKKI